MIRLLPLLGAEPSANEVTLCFFVTLALIVGSVLVVRFVKDGALIILGLLVAGAAMGYGLLGDGAAATQNAATTSMSMSISVGAAGLAATLMKVAVVLVLAGVARSLLVACCGEPVPDSRKLL